MVEPGWPSRASVMVELANFNPGRGDHDDRDRLPLTELLQKSGEGDFLRSVAEALLQLLMEDDVEGVIGAGRYERRRATELA